MSAAPKIIIDNGTGDPPPYNHLIRPIKFGVPLAENCKDGCLPQPLVDLLVYIAKEGVTTTDLFRRPGNPTDAKAIIKMLSEGRAIRFNNYNFYTLASVVKKFLLRTPGGVLGSQVEGRLLKTMHLEQHMDQYEEIKRILTSLPGPTQQLLALLFGTWFRIVNHSEYNTMSVEAVAKSVAGSLFHTCSDDPKKVDKAVQVMQVLIDGFGMANMFGRSNIQYFADMTRTGIRVQERFKYEYTPCNRDSISYHDSMDRFREHLLNESLKHGFSLEENAITEDEYYGRPRTSTKGSSHSHDSNNYPQSARGTAGTSAPPSPKSLQPPETYPVREENGHKKLNYCSSLSAPEVNQGCCSNGDSPNSTHRSQRMYTCNSLTRCDTVKRKQIIRMKKRSNWFLAPTPSQTTHGSHSHASSSSSSSTCGYRSFDGRRASSDVHMTEPDLDTTIDSIGNHSSVFSPSVAPVCITTPPQLTTSLMKNVTSTPNNSHRNARQSSFPNQHHHQVNDLSSISIASSIVNRSLLTPHHQHNSSDHYTSGGELSGATPSMSSSSSALTPSPSYHPAPSTNNTLSTPDYVNGNHHQHSSHQGNVSAIPASNTTPNNATSSSSSPMVTERDVRYFMVENWYGANTPVAGNNSAVTPSPSS